MSRLPNGLISFGPDANCTLDTCPLEASILRYQPSIPANAVFAGVFGLSLIIHAFQGIRMRTWGFMASMIAGCILEIIGYVGRFIIHDNPFDFNGFLMQISMCSMARLEGRFTDSDSLYYRCASLLLCGYLRSLIPGVSQLLTPIAKESTNTHQYQPR